MNNAAQLRSRETFRSEGLKGSMGQKEVKSIFGRLRVSTRGTKAGG